MVVSLKQYLATAKQCNGSSVDSYTVELVSSGQSPFFARSRRDRFYDFFFKFPQGAVYRFKKLYRIKRNALPKHFLDKYHAKRVHFDVYNDYPPVYGSAINLTFPEGHRSRVYVPETHTEQAQLNYMLEKLYPRHISNHHDPSQMYVCGVGVSEHSATIQALQQLIFCHQIIKKKDAYVTRIIGVPIEDILRGCSVDFSISVHFFSIITAAAASGLFCVIADTRFHVLGVGHVGAPDDMSIEQVYERAVASLHMSRHNQEVQDPKHVYAQDDSELLLNTHSVALLETIAHRKTLTYAEYVKHREQTQRVPTAQYAQELKAIAIQENMPCTSVLNTRRMQNRYISLQGSNISGFTLQQGR